MSEEILPAEKAQEGRGVLQESSKAGISGQSSESVVLELREVRIFSKDGDCSRKANPELEAMRRHHDNLDQRFADDYVELNDFGKHHQ